MDMQQCIYLHRLSLLMVLLFYDLLDSTMLSCLHFGCLHFFPFDYILYVWCIPCYKKADVLFPVMKLDVRMLSIMSSNLSIVMLLWITCLWKNSLAFCLCLMFHPDDFKKNFLVYLSYVDHEHCNFIAEQIKFL